MSPLALTGPMSPLGLTGLRPLRPDRVGVALLLFRFAVSR